MPLPLLSHMLTQTRGRRGGVGPAPDRAGGSEADPADVSTPCPLFHSLSFSACCSRVCSLRFLLSSNAAVVLPVWNATRFSRWRRKELSPPVPPPTIIGQRTIAPVSMGTITPGMMPGRAAAAARANARLARDASIKSTAPPRPFLEYHARHDQRSKNHHRV